MGDFQMGRRLGHANGQAKISAPAFEMRRFFAGFNAQLSTLNAMLNSTLNAQRKMSLKLNT
jgi:hypothetical protein